MVEWAAPEYHSRAALQAWLAETSLQGLELAGTESVLDVGCGDGRVTARLAERLPQGRIVGVDPSRRMIDEAARDYPQVRFEVGDARTLPYGAEFDLVVSFNALHWVRAQDQPQALASIARALRPGGRAFLQLVGEGPVRSLEDVIGDVATSAEWAEGFPGYQPPYCHPTPEGYRTLVAAAGLAPESVELVQRQWDFGTREAFAAWCEATFAEWTSHLPAARHRAFIAAVLDRYGAPVFRFYQLLARLRKA